MNVREILQTLRAHKLVIVLAVLASVAATSALTLRAVPEYVSTARLFVTTVGSDDSQAFQGGQFSLQRVKSYADLLSGREIASRVVDAYDLDMSPADLAEKISATSRIDTVILDVAVRDESPQRAAFLSNAVAEQFVAYVAELETPPGSDAATIKATVVDPASAAAAPVSPDPKSNLAIAVLAGLVLGSALAVARDALDTTLKSPESVAAVTDAPLLGTIAYDGSARETPLISDLDSYDPRVEAFRVARTNLQFLHPGASSKVYTLTSSLPGEGKTTVATNLAISLAEGGQRVCLVEGDLRRPRATEYLRLESAVGLTTVLIGQLDLDDAIQPSAQPGLDMLSSGRTPPNPAELLQSEGTRTVLARLRERYDVVLIDAPPLLPVTDAALLANESDGAILVVRYGRTTVDQLEASVERLQAVGARPAGVVLNMVPARRGNVAGYGYGYGYGYAPDVRPEDEVDAAAPTRRRRLRGRRPRVDA